MQQFIAELTQSVVMNADHQRIEIEINDFQKILDLINYLQKNHENQSKIINGLKQKIQDLEMNNDRIVCLLVFPLFSASLMVGVIFQISGTDEINHGPTIFNQLSNDSNDCFSSNHSIIPNHIYWDNDSIFNQDLRYYEHYNTHISNFKTSMNPNR